ncbi:MAG: cobalamin 5-phosphate synthase/cobalamin synthase [Rhodospirillales bacterium]|jgi:adenosylcobinamide-GDP ribazoletransferase|nr:cobalamin 5-phosphate synthase/cobalamin synthase [Rhodospirillales bacterium]
MSIEGRAGAQAGLAALATDLKIALIFFTRLPLRHEGAITGEDLARVTWANPLAGAIVGAAGGLTYAAAFQLGLPPLLSALLALAGTILLTGALHEDGLGDVADGFGGAFERDRKLAIMRDSRIGTYAGLALILSVAIRAAALAAIAEPHAVLAALIAAHAGARAFIPWLMRSFPLAKAEGLAAYAGEPPRASAATSMVLGLLVSLLALGAAGLVATIAGACAAWAMGAIARRQIGGYTGDVLGAAEQLAEAAMLLAAAALLL